MVTKSFTINNPQGFHMRPAGVLTNAMIKFDADVTLVVNGNKVNGKSIMNVMAACIKCGTQIEVICEGPQEGEAMAKFEELHEQNFGD